MAALGRLGGTRVVLSPRQPLVAGGGVEAFERQVQQLARSGSMNLIVDLAGVGAIDSAGIRALVRAHTSAQRVQGTLRLAAVGPAISTVLDLARLSGIFDTYESVEAAKIAAWPWAAIKVAAGGTLLCGVLVWAGLEWPATAQPGNPLSQLTEGGGTATATAITARLQPFIELAKLVAAVLIGLLVTAVHQPSPRERSGRSMEQAQMLLTVSGALMMIIIGNSLARAFGIAGAASIIRFRTPVEDPKDATILFLLMGLGMSTGLGAFALAGLGTAFLCLALVAFELRARHQSRLMSVEIAAGSHSFPSVEVEAIFARNQIVFEPREITQSDDVTVKYHVWLDSRMPLNDLSAQLMEAAGVRGVSWEHPKRA